jgi:hypothetical protein
VYLDVFASVAAARRYVLSFVKLLTFGMKSEAMERSGSLERVS